MKQFLSFVRKEFIHIFRDWRTMLILLAMPVVQMILFGFAITTEVKNVNVAIYDLSKDVSTERIANRIAANSYFTVVDGPKNSQEIDGVLQQKKADLVLVFEAGFHNNLLHTGEAAVQIVVDATDPNQGTMMANYVSNVILQYQQELAANIRPSLIILPEIRMLYNPQLEGAYNFVPGVMGLILMLICAMMTSISIVREKEKGSMEVLLVSPIKPLYIILSKAVPYFFLSIVNLLTILLLAYFVLQVPIAGNLLLIILVSLLYIVVSLLLGLLISNMVHTQVAAMLISGMGLMLPTMLLSGMIFQIESMPVFLQWVSNVIPAKWYIGMIKKLMIQGVSGVYVLKEVGVLALMGVFLLVVSLKKFSVRLS